MRPICDVGKKRGACGHTQLKACWVLPDATRRESGKCDGKRPLHPARTEKDISSSSISFSSFLSFSSSHVLKSTENKPPQQGTVRAPLVLPKFLTECWQSPNTQMSMKGSSGKRIKVYVKVLPFLLLISCCAPCSVCSWAPPNVHSPKQGAGRRRRRNHWQGGKGIISISGKLQDHWFPLCTSCVETSWKS